MESPNFYSDKSGNRYALILWLLPLALLGMMISLAFSPKKIMLSGIDTPTSVGPYLNHLLPPKRPSPTDGWTTEVAFPNLQFVDPMEMKEIPGTRKFVVVGKDGMLWTFDKDFSTSTKDVMLDITDSVHVSGASGLYSIAFHPEFNQPASPNSQYIYLYYRWIPGVRKQRNGYIRLSRFTVDLATMTSHDSTEFVMIQQFDRHDWHNGGSLFFDHNDFLCFVNGDEGGNFDEYDSGQIIDGGFFSGVFRIDVDNNPARSTPILRQPQNVGVPPAGWPNSFSRGYLIPNGNPWNNGRNNRLAEFWALGVRSPHKTWFDPQSRKMWLGDVGQGGREEITVVSRRSNLQWPFMEGDITGAKAKPSRIYGSEQPPIASLPHQTVSNAVIAGFIYRGNKWPSLQGKFLFGDHTFLRIYALDFDINANTSTYEELATVPAFGIGTKAGISAMATDSAGEIYVLKLFGTSLDGGRIYRLKEQPASPEPPALLSDLGIFKNLTTLEPEDFMIPYDLNEPFWSDDALKYRWMIIPNNGSHDTPAEQIAYDENGDWDFPEGSVLVKHFEMKMDESNPALSKRLETRLVIRGNKGDFYGVTYKWRNDQSDAELLTTSLYDTLQIATPTRGPREVHWYYPNRSDCMFCHNAGAKSVLGPKTRQLNGSVAYHQTGRSSNQLLTLSHLGIFDTPPDTNNLGALLTSKAKDHPTASLEDRARSYLDANCGYCHRPTSPIRAEFDARLSTPLDAQNIIYGSVFSTFGYVDSRVVIPGDLERSILQKRLAAVHDGLAMPPLAKNLMDTAGVQLIANWINSLNPSDYPGSSKLGQVISFPEIPDQLNTSSSVALNASSGSGRAVSYRVMDGPATVSGNILSLTGLGQVKVEAAASQTSIYEAAPKVERTFWVLPAGSGLGRGLRGTYYDDLNMTNEIGSRLDPQVNFQWGSGAPLPGMQLNTFAAVWEGEIESPFSEAITFQATTDDGVRLYINDSLVIDNWQDQAAAGASGTYDMQAFQRVPIRIEYYENRVYARAILEWSSNSMDLQVVPSIFLYPSTVDLPIQLFHFDAEARAQGVRLKWESSLEEDASHYEIERSFDGNSFTQIGKHELRGRDGKGSSYDWWDRKPVKGINFYRLKMMDLDGNYSYSSIREVNFDQLSVNVFPNPIFAGTDLTVRLNLAERSYLYLQLYDLQGRLLWESEGEMDRGRQEKLVSTYELRQGTYLLKVNLAGGKSVVEKILVK